MTTIYQIHALDSTNPNRLNNQIFSNFNAAKIAIDDYVASSKTPATHRLVDYGYGVAVLPKDYSDVMHLLFGIHPLSCEIHAFNLDKSSDKPAIEYLPYADIKSKNIKFDRIIIPIEIDNQSNQLLTENQILNDFGKFDNHFETYFRLEHKMNIQHAVAVENLNGRPSVVFRLAPDTLASQSEQVVTDEFNGQFLDGYFENGIEKPDYTINYDMSRPIVIKKAGEE